MVLVQDVCKGAKDKTIVKKALAEKRILLSLDKDMGTIYYFHYRKKLKVVVLRLGVPSIENIAAALDSFLEKIGSDKKNGLYIVRETGYRVLR